MQLNAIKAHWEASGKQFPGTGNVTPTSRDPYLGELERSFIAAFLKRGQSVLEIGCGDASHTVHYAKKVKHLTGVDIAQSLLDRAAQRVRPLGIKNIRWVAGSILELDRLFPNEQFDCVITQRCIINLPQWKHQQQAFLKIHQRLKKGGLFLMSEGFQNPLDELNKVRTQFQLPLIKTVAYNKNIDLKKFTPWIQKYFRIQATRHYGEYLFFSRVYHPLMVAPEAPQHDARYNQVARDLAGKLQLPGFEKYSYNRFYCLKKI